MSIVSLFKRKVCQLNQVEQNWKGPRFFKDGSFVKSGVFLVLDQSDAGSMPSGGFVTAVGKEIVRVRIGA